MNGKFQVQRRRQSDRRHHTHTYIHRGETDRQNFTSTVFRAQGSGSATIAATELGGKSQAANLTASEPL